MNEIKRLQQLAGINEIKINNPNDISHKIIITQNGPTTGLEGYENFITDYGNIVNFIRPIIYKKFELGEGLGENLINFIVNNLDKLSDKYEMDIITDSWRTWLDKYKDNLQEYPNSSGGVLGGLDYNDEWLYTDDVVNIFNLDEEEISDYFNEFKNW